MFKPGKSGNPSGRPKKSPELKRIEDYAQQHSEEAIEALCDEATNGKGAPRVAAAIAILDRGWGRPVERQEAGQPGAFGRDSPDDVRQRIRERRARLDNPDGKVVPIKGVK